MILRDANISTLKQLLKDLSTLLKDINFLDNFRSFQVVDETIAAGTTAKFRNKLNVIPTTMMVNKQTGNGLLTAGSTAWDETYVYVKNNGAESVTATITFMR